MVRLAEKLDFASKKPLKWSDCLSQVNRVTNEIDSLEIRAPRHVYPSYKISLKNVVSVSPSIHPFSLDEVAK